MLVAIDSNFGFNFVSFEPYYVNSDTGLSSSMPDEY
jgi:hypothetical protein